jgi:hypothetical protein
VESRTPEEPTSISACCMVAGLGEHRRAEQEVAAVIAGSLGVGGEPRAQKAD